METLHLVCILLCASSLLTLVFLLSCYAPQCPPVYVLLEMNGQRRLNSVGFWSWLSQTQSQFVPTQFCSKWKCHDEFMIPTQLRGIPMQVNGASLPFRCTADGERRRQKRPTWDKFCLQELQRHLLKWCWESLEHQYPASSIAVI